MFTANYRLLIGISKSLMDLLLELRAVVFRKAFGKFERGDVVALGTCFVKRISLIIIYFQSTKIYKLKKIKLS